MEYLITALILFVALEHFYFLILEMFLWTQPKTIKIFGLKSKELAEETKVLAANQGLYNGFLSAGLVISVIKNDLTLSTLFLSFVIIAGVYGAYSTKKIRLFYVQAAPAILTLILIFLTQ
jgi:putative membrane protein